MDKFSAVIIDDEKKNAELLAHFLTKYCPDIVLLGSALSFESGKKLINNTKPEVVFLDITLDRETGFELIDETDHIFEVIFVSAHKEYAIKAFKYAAVDYLLKPIDILDLQKAVSNAIEQVKNNKKVPTPPESHKINLPDDILAVPTLSSIELMRIDEILYCMSKGKYTIFYLENKQEVVSSKNLGEYEKKLPKNSFYRIHNRYIVNVQKIKKISKADGYFCELPNNIHLTVSARKQQEFQKYLGLN